MILAIFPVFLLKETYFNKKKKNKTIIQNSHKDDLGEEMYFIRDGTVNVLSANENQIIKTLSKGDYFGEIALFIANSRRICSVVAASNFVQVFILKKNNLGAILDKFPIMEEKFRKEGTHHFSSATY